LCRNTSQPTEIPKVVLSCIVKPNFWGSIAHQLLVASSIPSINRENLRENLRSNAAEKVSTRTHPENGRASDDGK
jgi:hypothetical protein